MITSDKQYKATLGQVEMLLQSMKDEAGKAIPEIVSQASKAQIESLIEELQSDLAEYEALKATAPKDLKISSLQDLLLTPIRFRIASNMSVDVFSRKVGVSARQIHRYEADEYSNTNTKTLTRILEKLDISLDGRVRL